MSWPILKSVCWSSPVTLLLLLLLTWPLAWKYTSFGLDIEVPNGPEVETTYYRIRWPGDGSIMFGRIDEPHLAARKPFDRHYDLGGIFLQPAQVLRPATWWNRLGFRWIAYDRSRDPGPLDVSPHAKKAWLIGFPHVLLIIAWAAAVLWMRRPRRAS